MGSRSGMKWLSKSAERKSQTSGYTLVEVVVAVFVLAIIAIAFYGALSSGFGMVQTTREDLRATQILMQKMEAVRLCTWSQLSSFSFREPYDPLGGTNQAGVVYSGTISNSPATSIATNSDYYPRMCLVTVTVGWTNFNGSRSVGHVRQMQTQVARYGLQNYIWGSIE
jgi:prepilin-type N-terminal cleavage/methylation domain-containing protein